MPTPTDTTALAALRPGDAKNKLVAAAGERWMEPDPALGGKVLYLSEDLGFTARLDRESKIGDVTFTWPFDPGQLIEGVHLGMKDAEVDQRYPQALSKVNDINGLYRYAHVNLGNGSALFIETTSAKVTRIAISNPKAKYSGKGPMPLPKPASTFNVAVVPGLQPRGTFAPDGWCCGLPRGIKPSQWPLSCDTGFPLEHHFTVRVPDSYRTKGRDYVALAVFANAGDESRSAPEILALMNRVFDGRGLPDQGPPELHPFVDYLRNRHAMEFRSKDILRATFSAIWLTEAEFTGPECEPPQRIVTAANAMCSQPDWEITTSAQRLFGWNGTETFDPYGYWRHRLAGRPVNDKWDILLLKMSERFDDPNTGLEYVDFTGGPEMPKPGSDYVPKYSEAWEALATKPVYGDLHFGGTASPDTRRDLTPFFIEFEESMGMINMAGRNGRIDLVTMMVDW